MFSHVHCTLSLSNVSFEEECKLKGKKEKEKKRKRQKKCWHGQGSNLKPFSQRWVVILIAQVSKVRGVCEIEKFCLFKMTLDAHLIYVPMLLISALFPVVSWPLYKLFPTKSLFCHKFWPFYTTLLFYCNTLHLYHSSTQVHSCTRSHRCTHVHSCICVLRCIHVQVHLCPYVHYCP